MELKNYIRHGFIDETYGYKLVKVFDQEKPSDIILLLEGKGRRKIHIKDRFYLHENYYPISFIGLEDLLLGYSRKGAAGVYPGSHYIRWNSDDFLNAVSIYPELARRAILEMSRRVRIFDNKSRVLPMDFKINEDIEIGPPSAELTDTLYQISFSEDEDFPPHLIENLAKTIPKGECLIRQNDKTDEIYIVHQGEFSVYHEKNGEMTKIDELHEGDFAGEMSQFDYMPRSATIIADTDCKVLEFSRENFHMLFQLHSKWSMKILMTLAQRLELRFKELVP